MTDEVSRVAAPCALSVVEGEEVDMSLLCVVGRGLADCACGACFDGVDAGKGAFGVAGELEEGPLCWVWMRVLTTSRGVVRTPAIPPAVAAVAISKGSPMLLVPMYFLAQPRSSS